MNGKDLYDALNEIDDEFIVEVTKADAEYAARKAGKNRKPSFFAQFSTNVTAADDAEEIKKPSVMFTVLKIAACIAVVAVLVGGGLMIKNILGDKKPTGQTAREWNDQDKVTPVVEPNPTEDPAPLLTEDPNPYGEAVYDELVYNSNTYMRQRSECTKVGEYLGSFQLTGYRFINEDEDPFNEEDNGEENSEAENSEAENVTVEVYAIPDISTDYAVCVKDPASGKYPVYARVYWTDNFADYAKATQLATYMTLGEEFSVIRDNQEIKLRTKISMDQTLNTLFRNQDIPIFAMYDMPNEFFAGTFHYDPTVGKPFDPASSYVSRYTDAWENFEDVYGEEIPYEIHPAEGSAAAQEFCKGKQIGTMSLIAHVNNNLLGEGGFQVYLYSGGWVVTDFFCIYVGPEAAADFMKILDAQIPTDSTVPN